MSLGIDSERHTGGQDSDGNIDDVQYDDVGSGKKPVNLKIILVAGIVVVVIVLAVMLLRGVQGFDEEAETGYTETEMQSMDSPVTQMSEPETDTEPEPETRFKVGVPDYKDGEMRTPDRLDPSTDFLKDLNGVEIPVSYNVKSTDYVCDYVNYEKRRASMDDGMELYWLELTYNGLHYRCTVPFWRYKAMNNEGICIVKMEVLTLEGGEKVISYMAVTDSIDD